MHFIFLKPYFQGPSSGANHYSGGQHGYACAAQALAAAGHTVHLLYTQTKSALMFSLMQQGCLQQWQPLVQQLRQRLRRLGH